jgi:hypothetical protein
MWMDAISINQERLAERNCQVSMMMNIFANAAMVLACVGPHGNGSELFTGYIEKLKTVDTFQLAASGSERKRLIFSIPPNEDQANFAKVPFEEFFNRRYWTRLWIVQEVAAARKLMILCGDDMFTSTGLEKISRHAGNIPYNFSRLVESVKPNSGNLDQIFEWFHSFQCEDPRDRLYGILGLIDWTPTGWPPLMPDYSLSTLCLAMQLID